ncbi:hypothetical protein [Desertihabitans brevis]|nr:hypothetical protein [Desertihabitans brevis]
MELQICTARWEVECYRRTVRPGTRLQASLTAWHEPALAQLVGRTGVPDSDLIRWDEPAPEERADWVVYGGLHGPHHSRLVAVEVLSTAEVRGPDDDLRLQRTDAAGTDGSEPPAPATTEEDELFGYVLEVRVLTGDPARPPAG